ncbi:hypothetical protein HNV12_09175 [Methanococcoides sp. SA1]|nr:hypothetical protein [Methanococcoides sp. SA1]
MVFFFFLNISGSSLLPKFKFQTTTQLSGTLIEMGMPDAFTNANFSGIVENSELDILHQAYIDVQEEGTEAAAATAIEAVDSASPMKETIIREFRADHPFMFFIEDKRTGCILFMGKIEQPEYEIEDN